MSLEEDTTTSLGSTAKIAPDINSLLGGISSKKRLFDSLFPKWELSLYPAGLSNAIAKVERHDFIKNELHRLETSRQGDEAAVTIDLITGKAKHRHRGQTMRRGLERLPISELQDVKDNNFLTDKKLPALTLLDERNGGEDVGPSVSDSLLSIVKELESLPWLTPYEQKHISNTFIVNFSRQYDNIYSLMNSSLNAKQNRKLSLAIIQHIKTVTKEIMVSLCKKKIKMQSAGLFSAESNGDRLISTFRTMLNRKLNKEEIQEIAMSQIDLGNGNALQKKEVNLLKELNEEISRVTHPTPKLALDSKLLNTEAIKDQTAQKQSDYKQELSKIMTMHFTNRGIMPIVDAQQKQRVMDIADDLIRLIKDNSFEQNLTGNVWLEDKITDSYQAEARELLQYEEDLVGHFKNSDLQSSEDPILRAHAHISNKRRSERPMTTLKEPTRYLKRKGLKVLFDFQKLLEEDTVDVPVDIDIKTGKPKTAKLVDTQDHVRSFASKTSSAIPAVEILMDSDLLENTVNDFKGQEQDSKITNVDFLDENLSRFKEVEELYSEIMKSVSDSKVDKDEGLETVLACQAAPLDQEIDAFHDPNSSLILRKNHQKHAAPRVKEFKGELKDADGIPISGNKFQIFMKPTKQNISADLFRTNRKKAMKKILSSKYHFKYNYGGFIPSRSKRKGGVLEDYITSDDYDDFLASTFCDFVPILIYQEKRRAETEKQLEEEARIRKMELEETELLAKLIQDQKDHVEEVFKPISKHWNAKVLDYMEDIRDPIPDSIILPENRPGLQPIFARDLQTQMQELWIKLEMPPRQKIDMGIKYGDHKTPKIEEALDLWNKVADLILDREKRLAELEVFERHASNPKRFFEKGDPGSSKVRLDEARKRQDMLKPFYSISSRIEALATEIKEKLKETVTFRGVSYSDKMKRDYRDILLKTSKIKQ